MPSYLSAAGAPDVGVFIIDMAPHRGRSHIHRENEALPLRPAVPQRSHNAHAALSQKRGTDLNRHGHQINRKY